MRPSKTKTDKANVGIPCLSLERISRICSSVNLALGCLVPRLAVLPQVLIQAKSYSMLFIFFGADPLKILWSVIKPFSVLMVYLRKVVRVGYESQSNQSMNEKLRRLLVLVKHYRFVTVSNQPRLKEPFSPISFRVSPYLAVLTSRIKPFVSLNISHTHSIPLCGGYSIGVIPVLT